MGFKPTDEDEALWKHIIKGSRKLSGAQIGAKPSHAVSEVAYKQFKPSSSSPMSLSVYSGTKSGVGRIVVEEAPQLNRRTAERLRKGRIEVEGTLDLHGQTQQRAHISLHRFILDAICLKKRCLLVITGKGKISKPSILKQQLPEWLRDPQIAPYILRHTPAQPKDGGNGAFYIYLKRQK